MTDEIVIEQGTAFRRSRRVGVTTSYVAVRDYAADELRRLYDFRGVDGVIQWVFFDDGVQELHGAQVLADAPTLDEIIKAWAESLRDPDDEVIFKAGVAYAYYDDLYVPEVDLTRRDLRDLGAHYRHSMPGEIFFPWLVEQGHFNKLEVDGRHAQAVAWGEVGPPEDGLLS